MRARSSAAPRGADGGAIALGGGSVLSPRVREALGRHLVVWLQVGAGEAWRRIEGTASGLWRDGRGRRQVDPGTRADLRGARRRGPDAGAGGGGRAGDAGDSGARGPAAGNQAALGRERLRRVPGIRRRGAARGTGGRRRAPVLPQRPRGRPPLRRADRADGGADRGRARRGGEDAVGGRAGSRAAERGRDDPLRSPGRARRRRDRRPRPASAPTPTSAGSLWSRSRPRWSPRRTPPTAGRPGSICRKAKNYVGAYHQPAAVIADWETLRTLPRPSSRPASSRC